MLKEQLHSKVFKVVFMTSLLVCLSCVDDKDKASVFEDLSMPIENNEIVLISNNAHTSYKHFLKNSSLKTDPLEQSGPYTPVESPRFSYIDSQNSLKTWIPKPEKLDTLVIPYFEDYLEISTRNIFTFIDNTYLVKKGDTIIFNYEYKIPSAKISNRNVNNIELNYNNYRLKNLFKNTYSSHHQVGFGMFSDPNISFEEHTINNFQQSLIDAEIESLLLDSLVQAKLISVINYDYRISTLNELIETHKNSKIIKGWVQNNTIGNENINVDYQLDLSKTDSLLKYSYFRNYLNRISKYNLGFIQENNGNSGAYFIDSRKRFDSILQDKRFNQTSKNYLLFLTYPEIVRNFKSKDKFLYLHKLREYSTDRAAIQKMVTDFKLNFDMTDQLVLTTRKNDTITYSQMILTNKGKWLYIGFWASWCKPCRETMPKSRQLVNNLKDENVNFIYIGLNDNRDKWNKAIIEDSLKNFNHYFVENGNTSKVIENLNIKTIPHYIIYNPEGKLVNGFANKPGTGAEKQLNNLIKSK